MDHRARIKQCTHTLPNVLIPNDLSPLDLDLLVEPLAVAATLGAALVGAALGAGVEAAQAILIQAVTQVHPAVQQQALAVVHFTLGWDNLPVKWKTTSHSCVKTYSLLWCQAANSCGRTCSLQVFTLTLLSSRIYTPYCI